MKINIKLLSDLAVLPTYAMEGDAGLDLTVTDISGVDPYHVRYHFGIAVEIPPGYVGLLFPRSSIYKVGMQLSNSVGVIDSGYRGELSAVMSHNGGEGYSIGDRAIQLILVRCPKIEFNVVDELSDSSRGGGGFGSTGL